MKTRINLRFWILFEYPFPYSSNNESLTTKWIAIKIINFLISFYIENFFGKTCKTHSNGKWMENILSRY